ASADGIPDSCDPFPDVPSTHTAQIGIARTDEDGDGWANRVDNCPLIANVDQQNSDNDGIGDACDPNPTVNDGHQHITCLISTVNIGAGGTAPYTNADLICSENGVGIDKNGNGIFDSQEGGGGGGTVGDGGTGDGTGGTDSDGDGVSDADDRCANTPSGATVDEFGCTTAQAQEDDDGDGVKNVDDECADTPAGEDVDDTGCSDSQLAVAAAATGPTGGGVGGPDTGVGSLAPAISSIPAWAAIASGLGLTGLLGSLGAMASRILRRRRQ
ncbi:MAG: thrombospondin type 3 repeat-containing protein, partial [Acidobacteria bacterium]|nr:thrombospondin type 3 repeat-containing protein [Acidobacteriota bacterium]